MKIKTVAVYAVISLFVHTSAYADLKMDIAKCAAAKPDSTRLACYDRIAVELKVDSPRVESTSVPGKWQARIEVSPIDDSKNAFMSLDAENAVKKRYDSTTPTLILRCKEKKLAAYITYEKFFLGSESTRVLTRFDKRPATTASWGISTDHSAVFVGSAASFIKDLLKSETFLIELTPYGESSVMATFDVRGVAEASKQLQQLCPLK